MNQILVDYLLQRPESRVFLLAADLGRTLDDLFGPSAQQLLPRPYKIFYADESQMPAVGFPVQESPVLSDLSARLNRWLDEEIQLALDRETPKDRARQAFAGYVSTTLKVAENALLSNLLADYHGIFWLTHSAEIARQLSTVPRRLSTLDLALGRSHGELLKYRLYARWAAEMREQMQLLSARLGATMDGEQERPLAFFRVMQDNVLIFTEEFIGPDLRELRSFVGGYLHKDFATVRASFDRLRTLTAELLQNDKVVGNATQLLGLNAESNLNLGLILNRRFQRFILEHPRAGGMLDRDARDLVSAISRRLLEFAILHQLRRGITWTTSNAAGDIVSADRHSVIYSKTTRPIDFGRPGVIDPMVYRFGLMYDIASFAETLGNLARSGRRGELSSYRQMVLFQRRVESVGERHRLQFEKFLGDGAFYTTRKPLRLILAAVEIQRLYAEMRRKGFAFDKGLRVALNHGYYRLLPMKSSSSISGQAMEFYGPGIVELSRLTTGKATKEIDEIQGFLITHGYDDAKVRMFFAPLAQGVDLVDRSAHKRDFYAYVNANGHLINEGIVASIALINELSKELQAEGYELVRIDSGWGAYFGFRSPIPDVEYVGLRLIGMVSLKGLDQIEVAEIVAFSREIEVTAVESTLPLLLLLRGEYVARSTTSPAVPAELTSEEAAVTADDLFDDTAGT